MSLIPVCSDDPILTFIRKEYKATALNQPDERIQPLCVIAWDKDSSDFIGEIKHLLNNRKPFDPPIKEGTIPDQSVTRSKKVNTEIGLQLLGGFLKKWGVDITPLSASFDKVRQVSFSFRNVKRFYLDKGVLGNELGRQKLNPKNIALSVFKNDLKKKFMLINNVITSSEFSLNVEKKGDANFEVSTEVIKNLLKGLKGKLEINSVLNKEVSFKGAKDLPFAFTCCELIVDWENGEFTGIQETSSKVPVPLSGSTEIDIDQPITGANELLSLDN